MEDMPFSEEKHDSEYLFYDFKNRAAGKGTSFGEKKGEICFQMCQNILDSHRGSRMFGQASRVSVKLLIGK